MQFRPFFLLIEHFMQFGGADWLFLPNAFEGMKAVWPFIKISDRPFLRNAVDMRSPTFFQESNVEPLLFELFFDLMRIFGSVEP